MEQICTRCARLSLRSRYTSPSTFRAVDTRTFSSSVQLQADNNDGNRRSSAQGQPRVGAKHLGSTGAQGSNDGEEPLGFTIRREVMPLRARDNGPPHNQQRSSGPRGAGYQGQRQVGQRQTGVLRQTGQGTGRLPSGQVQGGRFRRDNFQGRGGGRGGRGGGRGGGRSPTDRRMLMARGRAREERENDEDKDMLTLDEDADDYIRECVDPPVNPTKPITHVPGQNMSIEEFRKDWPNTPMSSTGLTESVQQRIEFMAHRLPHGYQTPMQLVERYRKGKLMRFESEEEKATVLKLAAEVSQQKADELTEKKGTAVTAKDTAFEDISSRPDERGALADTYVRGLYPELEKQRRPFLDHVVQNLRNNDTYTSLKSEEFMRALIETITSQGQQQQKGA